MVQLYNKKHKNKLNKIKMILFAFMSDTMASVLISNTIN